MNRFLWILVALGGGLLAWGQQRLGTLLRSEADLLALLPEREESHFQTDQFHQPTENRRRYRGSSTWSREGTTLRQSTTSPQSTQNLSAQGSIRFGRVENRFLDDQAVQRLGFDTITTVASGQQVRARKLLQGREIQTHTWNVGADSVDGDFIPILLRALTLRGENRAFLAQVLTKWDGGQYEMLFTPERLSEVLTRERTTRFPPALRQILTANPQAICWSMGLTGPASFFFPHKFYFVFDPAQQGRLLATWGGPPDRANFTWSTD